MLEQHAALIVSGVSVAATLFNTWLKLQIKNDILAMRLAMAAEIDEKYARKEDTQRRLSLLEDRRLSQLEARS